MALGFVGLSYGALFTNVSAAYFNASPVAHCGGYISRSLSVGSENDDVFALQEILSDMGYLQVAPNGYFGPSTLRAVMSFQRDNNLLPTGVVGQSTRDLLNVSGCDSSYGTSYNNASYYYNYPSFGYNQTSVTYVDPYDPYVRVISPNVTNSTVYSNAYPISTTVVNTGTTYSTPSSVGQTTGIIYSPYIGYTYSVVPAPGVLTITSPQANSVYKEGDVVYVAWGTSNLITTTFDVLLENSSTGQKRLVTSTQGNTASFVLTKQLLDDLCTGSCSASYAQGSFKVVIATPVTDIAGVTSVFRAQVSPITINRPYAYFGTVSLTSSKTPVSSGEVFKLYANIPTGASWDANIYNNYSIRIRAICPSGVDVRVAGVQCGQDFVIPYAPVYFQQQIPATITNSTWYPQVVTFQLTITDLTGNVLSQTQTNVTGNPTPLSW